MRKSFTPFIILAIFVTAIVGCSSTTTTESAAIAEPTATEEATQEPTSPPQPTATESPTAEPTATKPPTPTIEPTQDPANMTQEEKDAALFDAIRADETAVVASLLEAGADVNKPEKLSRFTPIIIATLRDNPDTFSLLLEAGADASIIDSGENTLLHHAATNNSVKVAKILLETNDFDLEHERKQYGFTPLLVAAFAGSLDMVELLVAHGANIEAQDDWNDTPLNVAAWNGKFEVVQKLVELGANPDVTNTQGNTALDHTQSQKHTEIEDYLLTVLEG